MELCRRGKIMKIKKMFGREILDSRGWPTIECNILLENGTIVKASVPSGASVGKYEALELRDNDPKRYLGKGVLKAISNIEKIITRKFENTEPDFIKADKILLELDSTENKSKLGANAILSVSMAICRAQSLSLNVPLYELVGKTFNTEEFMIPKVMFNVLNGGVHADNNLSFQEFMIMPSEQKSFAKHLEMVVMVYNALKKNLHDSGFFVGVGDEGGFAPNLGSDKDSGERKALDFLIKAVKDAGFVPGKDIVFCLDVAASEFYDNNEKMYLLANKKLNSNQMIKLYEELVASYPIYSIEDGLDQQDWDGWKNMTESLGSKVQLVGDDIFVTNKSRIGKGIGFGVANASLIKPNQIGTVTETLESIKICQDNSYKTVISHRSGETNDDFISDLVVGTAAGQFKAGAPVRGERVAKYNRLLEIESMLKK